VSEQLSDMMQAGGERAGQILVERLMASVSANNPLLPELLMASALPRSFDKPTMAALTGKSANGAEFTNAFSGLIAFPFVYERTTGTYSLHDSIRSVLLPQWRDRTDFHEHLQRLLAYHNQRYQEARSTAQEFAAVAETMRRINADRWSAAAERIEDLLIRPAIEAIHVALMIGPDEGWRQMMDEFAEFERDLRFRLCGMLVDAFAGHTDDIPAEARAAHDAWAAYSAARLADGRQRWEEAEEHLRRVPEPEKIDIKLASWIYSEKAKNLAGQCRYDEAIAMHDRDIALEQEHHSDPWNSSVPWGEKAQIYRTLWDQGREATALEEAAKLAEQAGNTYNLVLNQCLMVDALTTVGDQGSAMNMLLAAMRTTREHRELDLSAAIHVAEAALFCLGPRSARLLDAIAAQYRQLAQPRWPMGQLNMLMSRGEALTIGGNGPAAADCYAEARQFAVEHVPEQVWEVDSYRASLATILGTPALGADLNKKLIQDPAHAADKWGIARTLTNAADSLASVGSFREALDCVRQARQIWTSIHHERAVSLTWSSEADILRRLGDLSGAREALAKTMDTAARGYEVDRYVIGTRLALDTADYGKAAELARKLVTVSARTDRKREVTQALLATEALSTAGYSAEAAEISRTVQHLLDELEAFCKWKPTDNTRLADEHAARAIRIMVSGQGSDSARLRAAREHLELATQLDPEFGWFHLELAFVDLGQDRLRQAIRRLGDAARFTDDATLKDAILRLRTNLESNQPATR